MADVDELTQENRKYREIIEQGGTGGGDDTILMERLKNYEGKIKFLQDKAGGKTDATSDAYNDLFKRYNDLAEEFEEYKQTHGKLPSKSKYKNLVEINKRQQSEMNDMSSGISKLGLNEIDSDILDNFDSSYEYQLIVNEDGRKVRMPKTTQADRELLKLMNSDLWYFVEDQGREMESKLNLCEVQMAYSDQE